jgi:hypothetical protein
MTLFRAILRHSNQRFSAIADTVIWRMRRFPAVGLFAGDHRHRTLWDEYSHFRQTEDEDSIIGYGFQRDLPRFIDDLIENLSEEEACLLTIVAVPEMDEDRFRDNGAIRDEVIGALRRKAGDRDLSRFEVR